MIFAKILVVVLLAMPLIDAAAIDAGKSIIY